MSCPRNITARYYRVSLVKAIQSLDSLNDQIVQQIFSAKHADLDLDNELSSKEQHTLKSSMVLIRRLLLDAQTKFRKMVEDNKQLAEHIDVSITAANQEVIALRAELADTNEKLTQIGNGELNGHCNGEVHFEENGVCMELDEEHNDQTIEGSAKKARLEEEEKETLILLRDQNACLQKQVHTLTQENNQLCNGLSPHAIATETEDQHQENHENEEQHNHNQKEKSPEQPQRPSYGELKLEVIQTRQDLNRAKEALHALKADRKRLKAEKLGLLSQMQQLYNTLEDKETELRDFIRNYEFRMKESDESFKQLASEKEDIEREKWEIIRRARDAAERAVLFRAQLDAKDQDMKKMEIELHELREQVSVSPLSTKGIHTPTPDVITTPSPTLTLKSPSEELPPYETPPSSAKFNSLHDPFPVPTSSSPNDNNNKSSDSLPAFLKIFNTSSPDFSELSYQNESKKKKRRSFGSLSKVFSRGRIRRSMAMTSDSDIECDQVAEPEVPVTCSTRLSLLNTNNYQEKLTLVEQSKTMAMCLWKANQVLAWLEIVLSMPMYGKMCSENIKSGKVLLDLSDSELTSALGITNMLHRRKLRLAIEENRNPGSGDGQKSASLDHTWVAHRWIPDLGLPQYTSTFDSQIVDGRVLNALTRKDLEKHLNVHRRCHQASILHSVELLRRVQFDKEILAQRRAECDLADSDPMVWTNNRVIKWIQQIDLGEYAENLQESGVNGALMVLEPSFTAETMATSLGIPPAKSYVRRHLATELQSLLRTARQRNSKSKRLELETATPPATAGNNTPVLDSGARRLLTNSPLTRSWSSRASSKAEKSPSEGQRKLSFKGSLGRAFGKKMKDAFNLPFDVETSPSSKASSSSSSKRRNLTISGPISAPIHNSLLTETCKNGSDPGHATSV